MSTIFLKKYCLILHFVVINALRRIKMKKLREIREHFGLTQLQLGQKLGFGQHAVSTWEKGTREPDIKTLKMLSKFFNISIDCLLENDEQANEPKISEVQSYSEKQKELLPLIQMLNDRQCELTYDYLNNILDIAAAQQEKWGM